MLTPGLTMIDLEARLFINMSREHRATWKPGDPVSYLFGVRLASSTLEEACDTAAATLTVYGLEERGLHFDVGDLVLLLPVICAYPVSMFLRTPIGWERGRRRTGRVPRRQP